MNLVSAALAGLVMALAATAAPAFAQERPPPLPATAPPASPEQATPYDQRLYRLAEILGSVHYLRTLCKADGADQWRQSMQDLIDREAGAEAARRARMTAAFNRGYRSFSSVHTDCTPLAAEAEARTRARGATLAAEIVSRFGN